MIRRRYVPLRLVRPGMAIDQAIIDRAGRVLIAKRTPLESFHIDGLRRMGIGGIYICEGEEDPDEQSDNTPPPLSPAMQRIYDLENPDADVIRHYDVTGKICPKYYVENEDAWLSFKQDVSTRIEEDKTSNGETN